MSRESQVHVSQISLISSDLIERLANKDVSAVLQATDSTKSA